MNKRKTYTSRFKYETVRLIVKSEKPAPGVACQLGFGRNQIYKRREQLTKPDGKEVPRADRRKGKVDDFMRLRRS